MFPSSSETISPANFVVSKPGAITRLSGKSSLICSTSFFTASAISSSLKPTRLLIDRDIASKPFILEKLVGSLKVLLISATSPIVTTLLPSDFMGKLKTSCLVSNILGISTANFPDPVSWKPAGIRTLFDLTAFPISVRLTPKLSNFACETSTSKSSSGTPLISTPNTPGTFSNLSCISCAIA